MMKKYLLLFTVSLLLLSNAGHCQTKVERFCVIHADEWTSNVSTLRRVIVDYGQIESLSRFRDTSETTRLEIVKKFKTETGVLNYMESIGWTWVSTHAIDRSQTIKLVFKKSFDESELVEVHIK